MTESQKAWTKDWTRQTGLISDSLKLKIKLVSKHYWNIVKHLDRILQRAYAL